VRTIDQAPRRVELCFSLGNLIMKFSPIVDPTHLYFATAAIAGHRSIFTAKSLTWIVLDSWRWLRDHRRFLLYAYP
jgi:hypothetical protein